MFRLLAFVLAWLHVHTEVAVGGGLPAYYRSTVVDTHMGPLCTHKPGAPC